MFILNDKYKKTNRLMTENEVYSEYDDVDAALILEGFDHDIAVRVYKPR